MGDGIGRFGAESGVRRVEKVEQSRDGGRGGFIVVMADQEAERCGHLVIRGAFQSRSELFGGETGSDLPSPDEDDGTAICPVRRKPTNEASTSSITHEGRGQRPGPVFRNDP